MLCCDTLRSNRSTIALTHFRQNIARCCASTGSISTSVMSGIESAARWIESRFQRLSLAIIRYLGRCLRLTVNSAFGAQRSNQNAVQHRQPSPKARSHFQPGQRPKIHEKQKGRALKARCTETPLQPAYLPSEDINDVLHLTDAEKKCCAEK